MAPVARIVVTGASGLLGRAIVRRLEAGQNKHSEVKGWALNRTQNGKFLKVDLMDSAAVTGALDTFKPTVIVHSAAERRPDVVAGDADGSHRLNVESTSCLADWAASNNCLMVYISTDYVFDGTRPPYGEWAKPNPLNEYGRLKLMGEMAVQGRCRDYAILRVPILYGPCEYLGEGAVDMLLKNLMAVDQSVKMSDYEQRCPTHVDDVAGAIELLIGRFMEDKFSVHGIYHFRANENMTKWGMCQAMAKAFGCDLAHVTPDASKPPPGAAASRPYDAWLDRTRLDEMGVRVEHCFADGVLDLTPHVKL